jgi:CelD/BcsL family acetyltransferase involved in cellulose biosynthesis
MARRGSRLTRLRTIEAFHSIAAEWNRLAVLTSTPFLTAEWLTAWWSAFGTGPLACFGLFEPGGSLRAGVWCRWLHARTLTGAADDEYSGQWDAVAVDDDARAELWREVATVAPWRVELPMLLEDEASEAAAREALRSAGYFVAAERGPFSPYLRLPTTWDELLRGASRNLRSQLGRRRRALEREGRLTFRTTAGGSALDRDLDLVLRVEGSGWKARSGTAILSKPGNERLYRSFAQAAAARGWLRLHLLELDGVPIAVDYGCAFGGGGFLLKTGFDERYARLSPGLVLRAEVLRSSIEEGLGFYDFLGGPDGYKVRWTSDVRARVTLRAYRGAAGRPAFFYRSRLRPLAKALRDRAGRK